MDHHQDEEVITHEEILEEGQMGEAGAEYYDEEYIEVDETGGDEIVGDLDPGTYIGVDGDTIMAGDQYIDEEGQLGDGQIVRVVRSNNRQQQYPVQYIQHQGVSYPARRFQQGRQPGYGVPSRQYHVQPINQNLSAQGRVVQRQPSHGLGYQQQQYPVKRVLGQHYSERVEYNVGTSDGKIKSFYDPEMQDMKSPQVLRPADALINISNSSMASPMLSALPYQQRGSAGGPARDPLSGSLLPSYLTGSSSKQTKPRKSSSKKKPCNCTKSMCLKLYCDCFANGEFCLDCNCKDCHNNLDHEAERSRAIKSSLERNPTAFKPKIGVATKAGRQADMERLHQKGCHCKKSNCLKNYCECYEAKVPCTERCKCLSCRNTEQDRHHKFKDKFSTGAGGLAQLAAVAAADARSSSPFSDDESDACGVQNDVPNPKTQPWFYMTEDVIEATTMCLVAQAQEYEESQTEEELEISVLREFGRCLEQIIENANSCQTAAR